MELKENGNIEITSKEYNKILLSLAHILSISKAILSVIDNYFPTDNTIDGNDATKIAMHYDEWINSVPINAEDYTGDLGKLISVLNEDVRRVYYYTIFTISENQLKTSNPNYNKIIEAKKGFVDAVNEMAEKRTSEFIKLLETVIEKQ